MNEKRDFVRRYIDAYRQMVEEATKAMKEYDKELDIVEIGKKILEKNLSEVYEEDIDDWKSENLNSCIIEGRHEILYACSIVKVRYNTEKECIEVYLEDGEGCIHDWYTTSWITYGEEGVYMTILENLVL